MLLFLSFCTDNGNASSCSQQRISEGVGGGYTESFQEVKGSRADKMCTDGDNETGGDHPVHIQYIVLEGKSRAKTITNECQIGG